LPEDAPVDEADERAAEPSMDGRSLPVEPAEHHILAAHRFVDQRERLVRWVLQVVVHRDHVVPRRLTEPGEVGVVLPVVAQQVQCDNMRA
jgi:hypothetical protein